MRKASKTDKQLVINILTLSFDLNKSVEYITGNGRNRQKKMRELMAYSFNICNLFGEVFLSDDDKCCALLLFPEKRKTNLRTIWLDAKLVIKCIGLKNLFKVMKREKIIKQTHPNTSMYYLWFVGVIPTHQGKGLGTKLLRSIISRGAGMNRIICLETSTIKNLPWYKNLGFEIYAEKDFNYSLYFLKLTTIKGYGNSWNGDASGYV